MAPPDFQHELSDVWQQFVIPVGSILGTIAMVLVGVLKFRDKRMESTVEASRTWRDLAEARDAEIDEKDRKLASRDRYIARLERQNQFLWDKVAPSERESLERLSRLRDD